MDEILKHFGPCPEEPAVQRPASDEAQIHAKTHLAPAEVAEWAASVIAQEADAERRPADHD